MNKKGTLLFITIGFCLVIFSNCTEDSGDPTPKDGLGLVTVSAGYENDTLLFDLAIQYQTPGSETELEYSIYDGTTLIQSGSATTLVPDAGLNIIFRTPLIKISMPQSTYGGKTILVWADPENKKTLPEFTTEQQVETWKKQEVKIPD